MLSITTKTSKKLLKSSVKTGNLKTRSVQNLATEKIVEDREDIQTDIQIVIVLGTYMLLIRTDPSRSQER